MNNTIHHNAFFHTVAICYGWLAWWTTPKRKLLEADWKLKKRQDRNLKKEIDKIKENERNGEEDLNGREYLSLFGIILSTDYVPLFLSRDENGELEAEIAWNISCSEETAVIATSFTIVQILSDSIEIFKLESVLRLKVRRLLFKLTPPSDWDNYVQFTRTLTSADSIPRLSISEGFSLPIFSRPPPSIFSISHA